MPISIVVGGQFGSEGKGKVAHFVARDGGAAAAVRIGGPNSGHTAYDEEGRKHIFRQLPTAALLPNVRCVLAAGSYIDVPQLMREIHSCNLPRERLLIDHRAVVITERERIEESLSGIQTGVGSTLTGTGAAVQRRIARTGGVVFAQDVNELRPFIGDCQATLTGILADGGRIVIEGTQGYGLSVIHSPYYPFATSRDTTAAGFLSEVGLSPLSVDDIVLVLRAFPIRVPGNSGPLPLEIDWAQVTESSGSNTPLSELTSVTQSIRRVANFDPSVVKKAVIANAPTRIVLNHVDYFDRRSPAERLSEPMIMAVKRIEELASIRISHVGTSPTMLHRWSDDQARRA